MIFTPIITIAADAIPTTVSGSDGVAITRGTIRGITDGDIPTAIIAAGIVPGITIAGTVLGTTAVGGVVGMVPGTLPGITTVFTIRGITAMAAITMGITTGIIPLLLPTVPAGAPEYIGQVRSTAWGDPHLR